MNATNIVVAHQEQHNDLDSDGTKHYDSKSCVLVCIAVVGLPDITDSVSDQAQESPDECKGSKNEVLQENEEVTEPIPDPLKKVFEVLPKEVPKAAYLCPNGSQEIPNWPESHSQVLNVVDWAFVANRYVDQVGRKPSRCEGTACSPFFLVVVGRVVLPVHYGKKENYQTP